jgi:arsenite methyltransferase
MAEDTYQLVQDCYGSIAKRVTDTHSRGSGDEKIAMAFGYSLEDLQSLPDKMNLGLSCGNPVASAKLKQVRESILLVLRLNKICCRR